MRTIYNYLLSEISSPIDSRGKHNRRPCHPT